MHKSILLLVALGGIAQAHPHHPAPPLEISERRGDELILSHGRGWRKAVVLDSSTRFSNSELRRTLKPGDQVDVRDRVQADGRYHVEEIRLRPAHPVHGKVLALNSRGFLVEHHGEAVQVDVSEATTYRLGWLPVSRAQVSTRSHVQVEGQPGGPHRWSALAVTMPFPWLQLGAALGLSGLAAGWAVRRRRPGRKPRPRVDD